MIGKRVRALLVTVLAATPAAAQGRPPNFVLILMDDMGCKDLGVTGSLYHQTPNIDRIARAGMIFSRAYSASPLCSPSRGALLSGKAPARTALTNVIRGFDDPYGGLHEITKPMEWPNGNTQYLEAFAPPAPAYGFADGRGARIREDYEGTRERLFLEGFVRPLADWSRRRGVALRLQAHGGWGDYLDGYALAATLK